MYRVESAHYHVMDKQQVCFDDWNYVAPTAVHVENATVIENKDSIARIAKSIGMGRSPTPSPSSSKKKTRNSSKNTTINTVASKNWSAKSFGFGSDKVFVK